MKKCMLPIFKFYFYTFRNMNNILILDMKLADFVTLFQESTLPLTFNQNYQDIFFLNPSLSESVKKIAGF